MKFQLLLDTRTSTGSIPAQAIWSLNQGIVGATSVKILSLNFANSIAGVPCLTFNSVQLNPSDMRLVQSDALPITVPFYIYIVNSSPFGSEGTVPSNTLQSEVALAGQGFNYIAVDVRDATTGNIATTMSDWIMLLEFTVPNHR
jgi:hypothetical protein